MMNVCKAILTVVFLLSLPASAFARAETMSVYDKLLKVFPYVIPNATDQAAQNTMQELLGANTPELKYPAFPRTWVELGLIDTQESNTSFKFSTTALSKVVPLGILSSTLSAGVGVEYNIGYKYSTATTFIAMTSLRKLNPDAAQNTTAPFATNIVGKPRNELRTIIHWDEEGKRNYFKVDEGYPMVGLCKFDLTLQISRTKKGSVDFIIGSHTEADDEVQTYSYAVYSNFFQLESHVPIQDYLRVKCKEHFSYAVRYIAETDFNKLIAEYFAHYHPSAECELPEGALDPKGDASCMKWFRNPLKVMGMYRKLTVPRCVQNSVGIPKCVVRSIEGKRCPLYWENGSLVDRKPGRRFDYWNYATADDTQAFYCDKGLKCLPPEGNLTDYSTGLGEKLFGIDSRCKK